MADTLGVHETLEVHEILNFKNLCLTKSTTMSNLAQDQQLKDILQSDITKAQQQIKDLQNIIS
ncbi:hypothetical protein JOD43_003505 [Pullulanibacillus pueri]|uniref:Spore coat protein CotF n=1 Tax=Pullulanibacillus pueri TaxID=1437324 RepID=A0A8J2ZYP3_9BACL|nr:spore coat protein [Pullulanibacillus pueri]MBM7683325.1 hypothetical protein [Pullulanibacillus pueri]GGH86388.1 spore coat protein CotF [Pullulanibacillus pueri]